MKSTGRRAARSADVKNPHQPHPGTQIRCYRCSLPGLAEFTTLCCERTNVGKAIIADGNRVDHVESTAPPHNVREQDTYSTVSTSTVVVIPVTALW